MSHTQNVNERLAALVAAGTSVWLDQISRSMIDSGEFQRLIDEDSLKGMTSNPAIFEKAILGSAEYDEQIEQLAKDGADARAIYRAVAIRDVQEAADVLRQVYDATDGYDGYVSLEVDPDLAHDTDKTIAQAREYWKAVDRPNLMIKIPGTTEGVPAIEQAISEGINVNVTLLFAVESYANIAEAFIKGLETRHAKGESLEIHSVASFFVSRVDSEVDKRLEGKGHDELLGTAGLANARAAYQRYKEIFLGERFAELKAAGAPVQRPLWASTGVKNPDYSSTMYVDGLVAPETVNTMPMDTLKASAESAQISGATADQDPTEDLKKLADAGIDMEDVTQVLLDEGIEKFITPMDGLLGGIEVERLRFLGHQAQLTNEQEKAIGEVLNRAHAENLVQRIWDKDDTLWGEAGQPEVSDRLGWLDIADRIDAAELTAFADEVREAGFTDLVLLGMGGSSLAPEVFWRTFGARDGYLTLHLLDSTDAADVAATQAAVDLDHTLFLVSTKSGGTIETLSAFKHFWSLKDDGSHYVAITDPASGLVDLAEQHGFRRTFLNDANIGGRYSALSYFGLVPAALIGADVAGILDAARGAAKDARDADSLDLWLGAALAALAAAGRDKATFVCEAPLGSFGLWVEQLVAESTGKHGKGILPVADEPLGAPDVYGDDRVFVQFRTDGSTDAKLAALADAGHPVLTFTPPAEATSLGIIMFASEFAIAVAGWALEINPFDQPNVQEAKDNTKKVLDAGDVPKVDDSDDVALKELLGTGPPHYVAIMAYTKPDPAVDAAAERLRVAIRAKTQQTTTFGYGPRFLHSTGQLHKGGPKTGRFLQLVADVAADVDVPGEAYSFETLKHAQAAGDLQTLAAHELPSARVNLPGGDVAGAIDALTSRIEGLL